VSARRRSRLDLTGPLSELPLGSAGLERVEVVEVRPEGTTGFEGRLRRFRPVPAADSPQRDSWTCLAREPRVIGDARGDEVRFEHDGSTVRAQVAFGADIDLYGAGEVCGPLRRNGRLVELWNTDAWRYDDETPALYQSHPWVLALLADGSALGILADAFRSGEIELRADGLELRFEREAFDVYLVEGDGPEAVLRGLGALVGTIGMPPAWALGYHQCRWSYASAGEALAVARGLRERRIPCDAIWLDIDHMDRRRSFTWHPERFADPAGLLAELHELDFHAVAIIDPGVADAADCALAASGRAGRHFVEDRDGEAVRGRVWPGVCLFPDFTREETRAWWSERARDFMAAGLDGLWADMNEPSVFRAPGRTLPPDARHRGLGGGDHRRFHNLYGRLMAEATNAGVRAALPERRPFVLSRSNHLGGARFAAAWTGDNQATWPDLAWSIPMVLNLGLSGQPFSGPDLGGYDGDPSPELYARWMQLGAWLPFCRGHAERSSCRKEPWAFGPEVEAIVRAALERRMRLLPTLYTLFRSAALTGLPVVRPLFFADPAAPALRAVDDAFLVGDDLLVTPVIEEGAVRRAVLLPANEGGWYDYEDGTHYEPGPHVVAAPLERCPVFARAGSVVVEGPGGAHSAEALAGPLRAHAFLDREGHAAGRVYEDEGDGWGFERGDWRETNITVETRGGEPRLATSTTGERPNPSRILPGRFLHASGRSSSKDR